MIGVHKSIHMGKIHVVSLEAGDNILYVISHFQWFDQSQELSTGKAKCDRVRSTDSLDLWSFDEQISRSSFCRLLGMGNLTTALQSGANLCCILGW